MSTDSDYRGFRTAGTRLTEEPLAHLDFHRSNLLGESIHGIHAFDKAHALMLTEQGILPRETGRAILGALRGMEAEGMEDARARADGGMHSGEHYLIQTLGHAIGGRLHLGRSSGDLIEVARRLTYKAHVHRMIEALAALRGRLLDLAVTHRGTVMPGYTHGQHAQPTTFAHWCMMFEACFARDAARLLSFHQRLNMSPAGAAIMTGSDFPLDRHRTAALLGFDAPLPNTMDAILSHDLEMEYASVLAVLAQTLGRVADDLFLWSTTEFAMVELPDRYCGTSSIMPQKKNPDGLEDMKGLAAQSLGFLVTVFSAEKGPTGFPIMERRNTQAVLWSTGTGLAVRLETMSPLLRDLQVREARMFALAGANWAQATDVAATLVRLADMDWRNAHHLVGVLVRRCAERGVTSQTATTADLDEAAVSMGLPAPGLSAEAFAEAMDPAGFVARRGLIGGPAPSAIDRAVVAAGAVLARDAATLAGHRLQAAEAAAMLEAAIDAMLAG
ncbi:argininosuccinate lyase [Humitalea sp. 24SJ18S-53]|uniref:argininosuccinate lyase n=1 Tax=Humitalea sp. 24SJ18S-53 TaxID=3422307 RepID=UPI003D67C32B